MTNNSFITKNDETKTFLLHATCPVITNIGRTTTKFLRLLLKPIDKLVLMMFLQNKLGPTLKPNTHRRRVGDSLDESEQIHRQRSRVASRRA